MLGFRVVGDRHLALALDSLWLLALLGVELLLNLVKSNSKPSEHGLTQEFFNFI